MINTIEELEQKYYNDYVSLLRKIVTGLTDDEYKQLQYIITRLDKDPERISEDLALLRHYDTYSSKEKIETRTLYQNTKSIDHRALWEHLRIKITGV